TVMTAAVYFNGNTTTTPAYFSSGSTAAPVYFNSNAVTTAVYFTANAGVTPGSITRTDGGDWTANGFLVGQQIAISGSALNGTGKGLFTITHVTATVITLSAGDTIKAEALAGTAETVTVRRAATITRTDALGSWINDGFIA